MENNNYWFSLKNKKRIVIKIGSSSLIHQKTGAPNYNKIEKLTRLICDLKNMGKEVILVSSGAVAIGRKEINLKKKPLSLDEKQACAAIGQSSLMTIYSKIFKEYGQQAAQILITKLGLQVDSCCKNVSNTIEALLKLDTIPIANENDTVSPEEIVFGDNDTLSAVIAVLAKADLLIILTDTNGLYTKDPALDKNAKLIDLVVGKKPKLYKMVTDSVSDVGTGGMYTKIKASIIANDAGIDMVVTNSNKMDNVMKIISGNKSGTLFVAKRKPDFKIEKYLK